MKDVQLHTTVPADFLPLDGQGFLCGDASIFSSEDGAPSTLSVKVKEVFIAEFWSLDELLPGTDVGRGVETSSKIWFCCKSAAARVVLPAFLTEVRIFREEMELGTGGML